MFDNLGGGVGPILDGSPGGGSLAAFPGETYQTPLLDITQQISGIELVPAKIGYIPALVLAYWLIEAVTGVQTTPPTTRAGNDSGHANFLANASVSPTNADINLAVVPAVSAVVAGGVLSTVQLFAGLPVIFDLTVGAQGTGGYKSKAKLVVAVTWVPL